jgi:hypothetical protein
VSQKADKAIYVTDEEFDNLSVFTFWLPKDKGSAVYTKNGYSYSINTYTRRVERISNSAGTGLDVEDNIQVIQKEHSKKEIVEEAERVCQKIMLWAFDEEGNFDGTLDISQMTEGVDDPKGKTKKDGFIEYINTVTLKNKYDPKYENNKEEEVVWENKISHLKIINNRMDWKPDYESDKNKLISNDEKYENYLGISSKFVSQPSSHLHLLRHPLKSYEWIYLTLTSQGILSV